MRPALWTIQAALLASVHLASADLGPYVNDAAYINGSYGKFPLESYMTFQNDHVPRLHLAKHTPACDDGRFYVLTPSTTNRGSPWGKNFCSIGIFDTRGNLVWHKRCGEAEDRARFSHAKIQTYNGAQYLTYFVGDTHVIGHGAGVFQMLDTNYNLAYTIRAHGNIDADYHEFTITEQGTVLFTAYGLKPANLSRWGDSPHGQAWDGVFQEIDIETNELLFEWRASEHYAFEDMVVDSYSRDDVDKTDGFDWYHINSIDKDPKGNYLISSRYASTITYIDGRTGAVLWNLGGRKNDFREISADGNATTPSFFCQHMPRWVDNYTAIMLFDNQAYWGEKRQPSRTLKIRLDTEAMTSQIITTWQHPLAQWSEFAGSATILENSGNIFVGYGYQPVISEFSPNGTLLCDTNFASQGLEPVDTVNGGQDSGTHSYRAFKQAWSARPSEPPSTIITDRRLFISWNGATEVRAWSLQARLMAGGLIPVDRVPKEGFESSIGLDSVHGPKIRRYRLKALGADDQVLGTWFIDPKGNLLRDPRGHEIFYGNPVYIAGLFVVIMLAVRVGLGTKGLDTLYKACAAQLHGVLRIVEKVLPFSLTGRHGKGGKGYALVHTQEMDLARGLEARG